MKKKAEKRKAETLKSSPVQMPLPDGVSGSLGRIMRPQAAYRWLLPQLSAITPQYIEMVLRGALAGNHVQQWELFDLMLDTWPELAACSQELSDGVLERKMIFEAFAEEDEDPTPTAQERCKLASAAMRRMRPDAAADENDLEGTIRDILDGWFRGVTCLEVDWTMASSGVHGQFIAPRATFWVHPVCFAFDQNGRLGLRVDVAGQGAGQMQPLNLAGTSLQPQPAVLGAFPPHKFLVGIHKSKSGTALGGSVLRPLAWWWCAANFASDWLLNLAQVFGLPFRWATYEPMAPEATVNAICTMLQNMGSAGWAAFPSGTTLELKEAAKGGSDHSPQGELLDRADRYARLVILGQTMSGSQDASKGGGKAFGAVESDVKARRINAAAKYACSVLNTQLIPSILTLNYGDSDEAPCVRLLEDKEGDLSEAQRDKVLADAGLEIPKSFLRKKYGLPAPSEGEESIGGKVEEPQISQIDTDFEEDEDTRSAVESLKAAEGHPFYGNQHTMGIPQGLAPGRIKAEEADRQLVKGFQETDKAGKPVRFGLELKEKLDRASDGVARKELLGWARDTVRTGKAGEKVVNGEVRTHYGKIYQDKKKRRGFLVIVDSQDGYAFNIHITKPSQLSEKLKGRDGANTGEQPPAGVLQAIAAASGLPDWDQNISTHISVKQLEEIATIEDDALFARELDALLAIAASGTPEGNRKGWDKRGRGRRESRTRGNQDQFGHLPDSHGRIDARNNVARGHKVIRFLRNPGQRVEKAMFRADVGSVGMEYGSPDHATGWGNSHILSKHGKDALQKVPQIIQHGALHKHDLDPKKRYLFLGDDLLILKRTSSSQTWTVSSFEAPERIGKVLSQKAKGGTP